MVQCLGFAIYRALDWGLDDSEERELSPQLERLIDLMANSDSEGVQTDEGYEGTEDEDEEGPPRVVRHFAAVLRLCASRLPEPHEAQPHYQAVCRALFAETVELRAFLINIREAKEMLMKMRVEETEPDGLVNLQNTDWTRLWVQLMRDLRHGVQLKKVQEKTYNSLPTEYQLTPFEMLMQDIRARNYKLRKVMVGGSIPSEVKKDAHELILDFIRSRPPLRPVSQRNLPPLPFRHKSLHEKILEEIKQEPKLRPVETQRRGQKGFGSLPCIVDACSSDLKSTSCTNLSLSEPGAPRLRPRTLLKAPTLAEMEEMNLSEEDDSPSAELRRVTSSPLPLKRDRSFSEQDLAQLQNEMGHTPQRGGPQGHPGTESRARSGSVNITLRTGDKSLVSYPAPGSSSALSPTCGSLSSEFSHPVDTLALTVEEVINVAAGWVKGGDGEIPQSKELYTTKEREEQVKLPAKKMGHIPVYTVGFETPPGTLSTGGIPSRKRDTFQSLGGVSWRNIEGQFPHIYAQGSALKDVCTDCASFITDVVCSSRKSVDILNMGSRASRAHPPLAGRTGKKV
ncbi:hypothetical protein FKM82_003583 [Ascaphus truei]